MSRNNLFEELKRRNVYKVAVAYVVVSWLLIQAASILLPTFDAPASAMKILVALLAIGFPIALGFSWAFEITPEGIKRESEVTPEQSIASHTGRRLVGLTIVLAVIAAGLLAYQMLRPKSAGVVEGGAPATPEDASAARTGLALRGESSTGARPSTSSAPAIPEKSIAVLPFDNLSDEKANAYFAEGIQDEILTRLAKIGALKVISRSSTKQYQAKPGNLREIAQQLGVANILEGSVQKAGSAVHVNVQLIKAMTDDHLWAESYDRTLENIFGVEGEIAQAVADSLKAKLTGAEEKILAQKPTTNPAAYEAYLRGTSQYSGMTNDDQKAAVLSFEEAVRLDPQFATAWAALSQAHSSAFFQETTAANRDAAEKALKEATRLQPDLPETQLARAYFQYWVVRDYPGALEMMRKLRASWPNNAEVLHAMSLISARLGRWPDSLDYLDQSVALNPKELVTRNQGIAIGLAMREFPRALAMLESALQIWPNNTNLLGKKAYVLQARGQLDEAQAILSKLSFDGPELDSSGNALWYQSRVRRDFSAALKVFDAHAHGPEGNDPQFLLAWAILQKQAGRAPEAQAAFTRSRDLLEQQLKEQPNNANVMGPLIFALAALGQRDDALKMLARYDVVATGDARAIGTGHDLRARALVRLGDKDGAIASLEQLLAAPSDPIYAVPVTPATLRVDPDFDSLHGDPRFEKLCQGKTK